MIETYLTGRKNLIKVVQLVDIRHEPTAQDVQMYEWLKHYGMDGFVVATKADKVSKNEWMKNKSIIMKKLGMKKEDVLIPVSTLKRTGCEELLTTLEELMAGCQDG